MTPLYEVYFRNARTNELECVLIEASSESEALAAYPAEVGEWKRESAHRSTYGAEPYWAGFDHSLCEPPVRPHGADGPMPF